jgi:tetratricopeptide (TPR) repeat protein
VIDEGLRCCGHEAYSTRMHRLLLMIKVLERDIYEAHHIAARLGDEPELRVLRRFVEGVIALMRRNPNEGIILLLSVQEDLGFCLEAPSRCGSSRSDFSPRLASREVEDEFAAELKKVYLLFLSYGYITVGEFETATRLIDLQTEVGVPGYFELGLSYNREVCLGILRHCQAAYEEAEKHFLKAKALYENKLEPPFSLALNYLQRMLHCESEVGRLELVEEAKGEFEVCRRILGHSPSNAAASLYYFNCLLHGYLEEWKEALLCIDESIDRSEDHYWRYFYLRGMLLACIHSFREAISDLTVAANLAGASRPECYLLRSKCLQIEGDGNEAFRDLQEYICRPGPMLGSSQTRRS